MNIGVDIRVLIDKYYSGISEYTASLLEAILRQDKDNHYKLYYNSAHDLSGRLDKWNSSNSEVIATHWPNKLFNYVLQKTLSSPKIDRVLGGVDVFWSPHFNFTSLSSSQGLKKMITVHDLSFLRYPEFFSARKNAWHKALNVKKILKEADQVIAVSENTKHDISELVGLDPEKIAVVYSGNNLVKREIGNREKNTFLSNHGLTASSATAEKPDRLILYLGNIEPRKNIRGLIEAYDQLRAADAAGEHKLSDVKLILAGAGGWKTKKIYEAWEASPYKDDIKFLGYITKADKEILYSLAHVFVYPSYYEGFGFPPLEAMTYGVPVVCSNVSSLPEVVSDAALMINPFKVSEISTAIKLVLEDDILRDRLITRGYERVKLFSWDQAAQEYLKIFKHINDKNK